MALEIERKFLVKGEAWKAGSGSQIRQGYLSRDAHRTVRIRLTGEAAWLTVKGLSAGATRSEFEYSIPPADAEEMLAICERPLLEKVRYRVEHGGRTWEVDEFQGDNAGLVVAEVELSRPDELLELPSWVGTEVTGDPRYYNSNLTLHPYAQWREVREY